MPLDPERAREQWARYVYSRDTGHRLFIDKANRCEDFFAGQQWDVSVVNRMRAVKRPTLTINTILGTLSSIFGEQIDLATEVNFKPRYNAPPQNSDILTKTYRFISDDNQLTWQREEVFADGCITSRGYYDVRLKFDHNTAGDVLISRFNPRAVLPDPDGSDYDPDTWNDVIVTSWVTADEIELMYNAQDAEALRLRAESVWAHGYDSIDTGNDRFGGSIFAHMNMTEDMRATMRGIRLIDRQHRQLVKMQYFVDPKTGDKMRVPDSWKRDEIALAVQKAGLVVTNEVGKRVRWTVTAEDFVLHDDWSPFHRFSIVPFFPHFRYGRTVGIVEGLIDPQELLNKSLSQELHIVNTMANSGWKVKHGALVNMEIDELEERGAETGLILEVNGDPEKDIVKITPNQIPQGLDRLSFKAESYIKLVSGRGASQMGQARPDQSGKLAEENKDGSDITLRKVMRNLERTDFLLARNVLDLIQNYYTDRRIMHIIGDDLTGAPEKVEINVPDQQSGEILNDLSLGTYSVVITSQKAKRTLEESEFEHALGLKKEGVMIPDRFLIANSNLRSKTDIIKAMDAQANSPEAQLQQKVQSLAGQLEVANLRAEASRLEADAVLKRAKAAKEVANTHEVLQGEPGEEKQMELDQKKHDQEMTHSREKHDQEMEMEREKHKHKIEQDRLDAHEKRRAMRVESMARAKAAASAPAAGGAGASRPQAKAAA
jgi:hypothetical protein